MTQLIVSILFLFVIDLYVFYGVKGVYGNESRLAFFSWIYWSVSVVLYLGTSWTMVVGGHAASDGIFRSIFVIVFILLIGKIFFSVFLLVDDIGRGVRWLGSLLSPQTSPDGSGISRYTFIVNGGLLAGTGIVTALSYGIIRGAHDYRVIHQKIRIKNLPKAFEGFRLLQISDIHSGSFWNKRSVKRGVRMINEQQADMIFFTGDLVNNLASEMDDYKDVFNEITAPMGIFSVLGNHDYAEYIPDLTPQERQDSLNELIQIQRDMGWDILMNEHRIIEKDGDKIAVIGIENWSAHSRFPKHGRLKEAYTGTEEMPVKLLLSHDPSHWRAEVLKEYPDIDVMFAGHTHGMQFGIETAGFRWSPVKYLYPEWAGLYRENDQYLYVNRGFGYLGYPGRLGIRPEITVFEFTSDPVV